MSSESFEQRMKRVQQEAEQDRTISEAEQQRNAAKELEQTRAAQEEEEAAWNLIRTLPSYKKIYMEVHSEDVRQAFKYVHSILKPRLTVISRSWWSGGLYNSYKSLRFDLLIKESCYKSDRVNIHNQLLFGIGFKVYMVVGGEEYSEHPDLNRPLKWILGMSIGVNSIGQTGYAVTGIRSTGDDSYSTMISHPSISSLLDELADSALRGKNDLWLKYVILDHQW